MQYRMLKRVALASVVLGIFTAISGAGAASATPTRGDAGQAVALQLATPSTGTGASAAGLCDKYWKSRTMNAKKVRKFVKLFKNAIKGGKDIATAFGVASSGTGIGTAPGLVLTIVAKFGGDFIVGFLTNKLLGSLKTYKQVGIKVGIKCSPIPHPSIGFHGVKK